MFKVTLITRLQIVKYIKSVKYACKYAQKLPKYALKTPKYALKNNKTSTTKVKSLGNNSIFFTKGQTF